MTTEKLPKGALNVTFPATRNLVTSWSRKDGLWVPGRSVAWVMSAISSSLSANSGG